MPGGEKTCDLHTLARSPDLIDVTPFYLRVPKRFHDRTPEHRVSREAAKVLHALALEALAGRTARSAIRWFETSAKAELFTGDPPINVR